LKPSSTDFTTLREMLPAIKLFKQLFLAYIKALELNSEPVGPAMITEIMQKELTEKLTEMPSVELYQLILEMRKCIASDPSFQGQKDSG
jgi:hypothetical protein